MPVQKCFTLTNPTRLITDRFRPLVLGIDAQSGVKSTHLKIIAKYNIPPTLPLAKYHFQILENKMM